MNRFADLYAAIDATNRTNEKVAAMAAYFSAVPPEDAAWAVSFLIGRRPKRLISTPKLHGWAAELAGIPRWLFQESYDAAGDLAETIALILPVTELAGAEVGGLDDWVRMRILPLATLDEPAQRAMVEEAWSLLDARGRLAYNKLITGAFRVGVSQELVVRALSEVSQVARPTLAHRLMGDWQPSAAFFSGLFREETRDADISRPYPFCLAHPVEGSPASLGSPEDWQAEWKWDGIRAQLVRRSGQTFLWSRGEELITDRFPEVTALGDGLPDGTVIDGEVLAWGDERPLKFMALQQRIGRKVLTKRILETVPVVFMAFDVLEEAGTDLREAPLSSRRQILEQLVESHLDPNLRLATVHPFQSWDELVDIRLSSRESNTEGLMLKRLDSQYQTGRKRGSWWKWKIDPFSLDAVLVYAQRGSGKRASLYTDYTFALWEGDQLIPFAKAYSGLTDAEIREVDAFVRRNTREKFGPVRTVAPELVMELAFEGIQLSNRHKSGVAVRFPRIARWRKDKSAADADRLEDVRTLLASLDR